MTDYDRIARILRYLDAHQTEQPSLDDLARVADLSPFHLHRLFSSWAAITPKDFLQCLTLAHAKALLARGRTTMDAALDTGLSGTGRLHDLCVTLEAATPGEFKSGGAGWTLRAGVAESPFGKCLVAESPRGLCYLSFFENGGERSAWQELKAAWPAATMKEDPAAAARWARRIFSLEKPANGAPLRAIVRGSAFQVRVWRALLQIPPGAVTSYGRLADSLGCATAARAVGSAVGQNMLAYLIPCHRVIRETGVLGEYRWGLLRKRAMLARESSHGPD